MRRGVTCKCPVCNQSEMLKGDFNLPYRYKPSMAHTVFHLMLHLSIPIIGALLIGASLWALIPFIAFIVTYVTNSLWFCPGCSYHHEESAFCGCFPRSVFPYRTNTSWGHTTNIVGWPVIILLMIGPSFVVLYMQGNIKAMILFFAYFMVGLVIHAVISCPKCRQRGVCYLGKIVVSLKKYH